MIFRGLHIYFKFLAEITAFAGECEHDWVDYDLDFPNSNETTIKLVCKKCNAFKTLNIPPEVDTPTSPEKKGNVIYYNFRSDK